MDLNGRIPGDGGHIGKRPVRGQISDKIAYMIHTGLLLPGDVLPSERELATTLSVSRETVRAAIGILQARRMVEVSQGSRTRVLGRGTLPLHESVSSLGILKHSSIEEVTEARSAIELRVIWLAAQRISGNQLTRLEALLVDQATMLNDPVRFQISDHEFHNTLYGACGNNLLANVVSDFYGYALEIRRRALKREGAIAHSVKEHHALFDALKERNPEKAVAAMKEHLEQVHRTTLKEMWA